MINIHYFASLRDRIDTAYEEIKLPANATIFGVLEILRSRNGAWATTFSGETTILAAINKNMAKPEDSIQDGDEVAFFPPVTGG